jgi:hypothetical protein
LGSAKFSEDLAQVHCLLSVVEEGSNFSFRCCCHDVLEDSAFNVDGAIALHPGVSSTECPYYMQLEVIISRLSRIATGAHSLFKTLVISLCVVYLQHEGPLKAPHPGRPPRTPHQPALRSKEGRHLVKRRFPNLLCSPLLQSEALVMGTGGPVPS